MKITIDGKALGRTIDTGWGGVSAGASSEGLINCPEPYRSEILDYLFKPGYGIGATWGRFEIGSDRDSTCGDEPSHEPEEGKWDYTRGYEWWLMREAVSRNPDFVVYVCPWLIPGWMQKKYGWASKEHADYDINFIKHAKKDYGVDIKYIGVGNERWNGEYSWRDCANYARNFLYPALQKNGLGHIGIIGFEDYRSEEGLTDGLFENSYKGMVKYNAEKVFYAVGIHVAIDKRPAMKLINSGMAAWHSESHVEMARGTQGGGQNPTEVHSACSVAREFRDAYRVAKVTGWCSWSMIDATRYCHMPWPNSGPIKLKDSLTGEFSLGKMVWGIAHFTRWVRVGWRIIEIENNGEFPEAGGVMAFKAPDSNDFVIVTETRDAEKPQTITFDLTGGLEEVKTLKLYRTSETEDLKYIEDIKIKNGIFTATLEPNTVCSFGSFKVSGVPKRLTPPDVYRIPYTEIKAFAENEEENCEAKNAVDGNELTDWYSGYQDRSILSIILCLDREYTLNKLGYIPIRGYDKKGDKFYLGSYRGVITNYNIYVANKKEGPWIKVARGKWNYDLSEKVAKFAPIPAKYIKLEAMKRDGKEDKAGAAEIELYYE